MFFNTQYSYIFLFIFLFISSFYYCHLCSKAPLNARKESSIIFHEYDHQVDNDEVVNKGHGESDTKTYTHTLWCYCKDVYLIFYIIFGSSLWGLLEFCLHSLGVVFFLFILLLNFTQDIKICLSTFSLGTSVIFWIS